MVMDDPTVGLDTALGNGGGAYLNSPPNARAGGFVPGAGFFYQGLMR